MVIVNFNNMTKNQNSVQDLIKEFTKATCDGDINSIENLLDKNGVFEIQDEELELIDTDKYEFLKWFSKTLTDVEIKETAHDQCVGCSFGHHVVLFNGGYFPRIQKDTSDREKIAFIIDGKEGKINKIAFCAVFLKTENKYIFECIGKIINEDMKKGITMGQAIKNFDTSTVFNHYKFPSDIINEDDYDWDDRLDCFKNEEDKDLNL